MTRVELTEATATLAECARKAARGPVVLTRRGRPVALLRTLTSDEREDLVVSMDPAFTDLIDKSRRECPPGSGRSLESVEKELRIAMPRRATRRRR